MALIFLFLFSSLPLFFKLILSFMISFAHSQQERVVGGAGIMAVGRGHTMQGHLPSALLSGSACTLGAS